MTPLLFTPRIPLYISQCHGVRAAIKELELRDINFVTRMEMRISWNKECVDNDYFTSYLHLPNILYTLFRVTER